MPALQVSPGLRAAMGYRKLAVDQPRMLVLRSQYWLDDACLNAARQLGWPVASVPVPQEGVMSRESVEVLLRTLLEFKPDFVLSVNMAGMDRMGLLTGFLNDLELPCAVWFVDDPRTILVSEAPLAQPCMAAFSWDAAYLPFLRAQGFGTASALPLAADASLFHLSAPATTSLRVPLAFVGNSMTDWAHREWTWMTAHPELHSALEQAFDAGRVTRDNFAGGLECILDEKAHAKLDREQRCHVELLCFLEGTRRLRVEGILHLLSEGVQVFGDDAWRDYLPEDRCAPYVHYESQLPSFYSICDINLNITSIQMKSGVNQRVFDCPLVGGFLLTDNQLDMHDLFEVGREAICYKEWAECAALIRYYRQHPEERQQIASRARDRILTEHMYEHRLLVMRDLLRDCFGSSCGDGGTARPIPSRPG